MGHERFETPEPAAPQPAREANRNPWSWVPSLYFAQGIPYVVVMMVSVLMYKRLGISNADVALYTSWLYLPWVIKPLWSPLVDIFSTKRRWIVCLQFVLGVSLGCVALTLPGPDFFRYTLAVFWLMAFASATHDIAADGFYMLGLAQHQQAAFVGVRSTFYRIASITGQGVLVVIAGQLEITTGRVAYAWSVTFGILAAVFIATAAYHLVVLPRPSDDRPAAGISARNFAVEFLRVFADFFRKPRMVSIVGFLLFYRFAEAQLVKMMQPFLLDPRAEGGLGLTTSQVGIAYGTAGMIALTCGGLAGGYLVSRHGLRKWLWPMVLIIHVPDLVFVLLSQFQPSDFWLVSVAVSVEQFGYGFGFTAYLLFMIMVSQGQHKTAHYAICTGVMALGMMVPGMFSGAIQEWVGYKLFFLWILLSTIPGFIVAAAVKIESDFGKR